ncbi:MAG: STAS domain-containing protein [Planctomyces sp.]|nr:STAS domain-containing protein [Planctomyces sp.]
MADAQPPILDVYQAGPTTVVGFGGREVIDDTNLSLCREQLMELLKAHDTKVLGFDLTDVRFVPSGLLGLLASVRGMGVEVHLYNPSPDVRDVLATTHLDRLMPIHEVDFSDRRERGE